MAGRVRGAPCWPPWQPLPSRELAPRFIPILLPPPSSLHPPPSPLHPPPSFNLSSISVCLSGAVSDINVDAPEGMSYAEWEASNVRKGGSCCCCWWCCCWRLHDVSLQLIAAATSSGSAGECPCLCPVVAVQLAGGPGAPANPRPDTQLFSAPPSLPPPPPPPPPPTPPLHTQLAGQVQVPAWVAALLRVRGGKWILLLLVLCVFIPLILVRPGGGGGGGGCVAVSVRWGEGWAIAPPPGCGPSLCLLVPAWSSSDFR